MAGEIQFGLLNTNAPMQAANAFNEGVSERRKSRLEELAAQQAEQQMTDDAAYRDAYKQSIGDQNALLRLLQQRGLGKQAEALQKSQLEAEAKRATIGKDQSITGKNDFEVSAKKKEKALQDIAALNTTEEALASLAMHEKNGEVSTEHAQLIRQGMPKDADPIKFRDWQLNMLRTIMAPKDQVDTRLNAEKFSETKANNARIDERIRSEGALNRGVQMRGQNMTDARGREATLATMSKPFEVTGPNGTPMLVQQDKAGNIRPVEGYAAKPGKAPTEFQGKSAVFGARAEESDKLLSALETDKNYSRSGALFAGGTGITNTLVNPMMSEDTQKAIQAQRDFVNAVLRQESGAAISPSEFDNAKRQYFPQPGDGDDVVKQKAANRKLAIQGFINSAGPAAFHAPSGNKPADPSVGGMPSDIADLLKKHGGNNGRP